MQLPVPEIPAVIPTPLEEGIEMIRANIWEYLNGIMKRKGSTGPIMIGRRPL